MVELSRRHIYNLLSLSHRVLCPWHQPWWPYIFFQSPRDKDVPPKKQKEKAKSETKSGLSLGLRRFGTAYRTGAFILLLMHFTEIGRKESKLFR